MSRSFSRRDALRVSAGAAMATTFLPMTGRFAAWSYPVEQKWKTRMLGRTGREVTTFGLAGGNKVMWDLPGDEGIQIVVKAIRAGITYLETANNYQLSQTNYGKAFRILKLIPGEPGYDSSLRARLFLATKTGLRYSLIRDGSAPMGRSQGGGKTAIDDLHRALSQFFGDGQGNYPDGAYLDLMQIHSLTHDAEVDAVFEGLENPSDRTLPRIGALAGLIDFRDGSNHTGLNPKQKKLIRHIGITGHENPAVHMKAMQRDRRNDLETLLVVVNPNDRHYFCHQTNSIPVAHAKGMGLIGMKVFADGVMYGLRRAYASKPGQSVLSVGQPGKVSYQEFLRYTLSPPGMTTLITGIGLIDSADDPAQNQLAANLLACQVDEPLPAEKLREIESRVASLHGTDTNFFQRPGSGLTAAPVKVSRAANSPSVTIEWGDAYAAAEPLARYEVYRRDEKIASIDFKPRTTDEPLRFVDAEAPQSHPGGLYYKVRAVDRGGAFVDSLTVKPV